jgi:hypothetical protein
VTVAVILLALLSTGCTMIPLALDAIVGGVSVYQRYEDRQAQKEQTAEIRKLREAIEARWPELVPTDR